jgi:hypothetical protein
MAYTTIDDPSAHFHTRLYSGNGSTQSITNDANAGNFKPDWLWIKERTSTSQHFLFDSTRGVGKYLHSDSTSLEGNDVHNTSFDSNGFGVGQQNGTNENSQTYVAWQWKANGGTTSSDSNGSITSTVQANTTAGFSIVTWTGSGTSNETVGHGLTTAPEVVILKPRTESRHWLIWFDALGDNDKAFLFNNETAADNRFGPNAPTSSVFGLYGNQGNRDGTTFVAYAFHSVKGYSKIGSYTGNGSTDGTFVYTGFKPAFILIKRTDSAKNWYIADSTRSPNNITKAFLSPNLADAEDTSGDTSNAYFDILSNGFKMRQDFSHLNASGSTQIYMAFAEHPFVSSKGAPVTAR